MTVLASPSADASGTATAVPDGRWLRRAQYAAIFAASANLFSTALANVAFIVFGVLFVVVVAGPERRTLAWSTFPRQVALAIALYLGWQAFAITYSDAPLRYALVSLHDDRKILYILPLALLFGAEAPRRRFLAAFMAVNVVALALSFGLAIPFIHDFFPTRMPFNVLHSHATQGISFAMACFLALWYVTQAKSRAGKAGFLLLATGFLLNILSVTVGRSGYLVFLVFIVVAFGFWRGRRGLVSGIATAAVLAVTFFFVSSSVHTRVMQGVYEADNYMAASQANSLGVRMLLYHTTIEMITEHPLLGTGTGSFKGHFSAIVARRYTDWKAAPFHDPHNQYLFAWAETGLPGLASFLFLLVALYRACDKRSIYGQMAAGCLLAWCATSMFSGHFRTFPEGHMIAFVLGVLMTPLQRDADASGVAAAQ
jgi:O-antigen ligase